jgi:hypothetical protein
MVSYPQTGYLIREIEDAVHDWISDTTGLGASRVWWQDNEVGIIEYPFATLNWLTMNPIGRASTAIEVLIPDDQLNGIDDPRRDVRLLSGQIFEIVLSVQVFAETALAPEGTAQRRLAAAIAFLELEHRERLNSLGLAIMDVGGITQPNKDQASCDITCLVASNVFSDITSIQSVEVSGTVDDNEIDSFTVVNPVFE